ncbi:crAss001_48 related protein [Methanobrevibacter sp.]|uniref:crAss001_48 related protein n=1 Tax=Methanobrevibacter sp. TaxID=66852 RepID=UPI00389073D3
MASDNITLKDTVELMLSDDYKDRFKAEYFQTKLRYDKLNRMIVKADAGTLEFEPDCPLNMLRAQLESMDVYLHMLAVRAEKEGIDLTWQG